MPQQVHPEILAAPLTLWLGPVGTAFPLIDAAPGTFSDAWTMVGTNGDVNYDSTGITVTHNKTFATWTSVGSTAPIKAWCTNEALEIAVVLADLSPEQYALAMNDVPVTTVAATSEVAGEMDFPLLGGYQVATFALLARGLSAVDNTLNAQYAVPCVYQSANPAPVFKLGAPAELALTYTTLLDPNGNGFGEYQQQTAAKT
jgi:hypothetical protein